MSKIKLGQVKEIIVDPWEPEHHHGNIVDIAKSSRNMRSFVVDVSWAMDTAHLSDYLEDLPDTVSSLSIRNQMFNSHGHLSSVFTEAIYHVGKNLTNLDLTGTLLSDSQLILIGKQCQKLEKLVLTRLFNIGEHTIQALLERLLPATLRYLCIRSYSLRPEWIIKYITVQQKIQKDNATTLAFLDIQECDIFTLRDIQTIAELTSGTCETRHSAILEDNTVEAYHSFIESMYGIQHHHHHHHHSFTDARPPGQRTGDYASVLGQVIRLLKDIDLP